MNLKAEVKAYLNGLVNDNSIYFFNSSNSNCSLLGSVNGQLVAILVIPTDRKISRDEINFSSRIIRSFGEYFVIRSIEDISEIIKEGAWI